MSIWTSKARVGAAGFLLAALSALSGCGGTPVAGFSQAEMMAGPPSAPVSVTRLAMADGNVVIAGPKGFCIDRQESHITPQGGFVLMGSCAVVHGGLFVHRPKQPAILTASVGAPTGANPIDGASDALRAYFHSTEGRAALSRTGRAETVRVLEDLTGNGVFVMRLRDTSPFPGGVAAPEYWRAVLDLGGHVVVLSILGVQPKPLGRDEGLAEMTAFIAAVRAATPATLPVLAVASEAAPG